MLQTLTNASIIWLCSLLVYEAALKGTTFHRLNRAYLLLTFLAGAMLPLLPWGNMIDISFLVSQAGGNAAAGGTAIADSASAAVRTAAAGSFSVDWLLALYLSGALAATLLLLRDLFRLRRLYSRAILHTSGSWTIAETGAPHAPFSFLHVIFVGSRDQYSTQQWQMLIRHEQQHFRSRHILDLALMQAAAIVFWFHPLIYVYRQRLRMLHEYEVDSLQQEDIRSYGRFLLEQAVTRPISMTHPFNFSPLKSRIHMLTKTTSTRRAKIRFLLLLPMMSCFIWCCTKNRATVGVDVKDQTVKRKDVTLSYPAPAPGDTIVMQDPVSGKMDTMVMTVEPMPDKLNDQPILKRQELAEKPRSLYPGENFGMAYVLKNAGLETTLEKMTDGEYYVGISNVIVGADGRIAYYVMTMPENHSDMKSGPGGVNVAQSNGLSDADKQLIHQKISEVLIGGDVAFSSAKNSGGTPAPYYLDRDNGETAYELGMKFNVRNHKLSYN